ncbi:hypothetical protein MTR67_038334 [Solanum verrucosum]|uniref:LIMR family protein n=1 Tax=Solanum verrucosum TaxID=315347 RepID=A0AAF0UFL8_SOLVR|nr:hypothetical protein MTR67_038334 [Solanum verrucosum]
MGDFNLALVIVAIVVCILVFIFNVYLLINYQHPDDANQAYFPKFVVVFGLSIAAISILMLPADVANRQACQHAIYNGACNLTLPMKQLWLAIYIVDAILVFFVIPFAMFYYEGDQDKTIAKRLKSAMCWVLVTAIVCALLLGILYVAVFLIWTSRVAQWFGLGASMLEVSSSKLLASKSKGFAFWVELVTPGFPSAGYLPYVVCELLHRSGGFVRTQRVVTAGLAGKADFTVRHLSSTTTSFPNSFDFNNGQQCIGNGARQCSAYSANASSETTWTMRATFPEYVVALATIVGSVLFTIFGGVGIACLPLGLIFSFIRRPKAVITRSQYIKEATELGKKAKELKKATDALHQEERSGSKGRKWRKNVKAVEKAIVSHMPKPWWIGLPRLVGGKRPFAIAIRVARLYTAWLRYRS